MSPYLAQPYRSLDQVYAELAQRLVAHILARDFSPPVQALARRVLILESLLARS